MRYEDVPTRDEIIKKIQKKYKKDGGLSYKNNKVRKRRE